MPRSFAGLRPRDVVRWWRKPLPEPEPRASASGFGIAWNLAVIALIAPSLAVAQATGGLSGVVEDTSGVAVNSARVTLTPAGSGGVYASTTTSRVGTFSFVFVKPGLYEVAVEAARFERQLVTGVRIDASGHTALPAIRLSKLPGITSQADVSSVSGEPASVEFSAALDEPWVLRLPLAGRSAFPLLYLLPGFTSNGRTGAAMFGEPVALGNLTYEGINLQQQFRAPLDQGSATYWLHTDQVAGAAFETGAIDGNGGAQTTFTAPSGTDSLHGSAYWLGIPSGLASQLWSDNSRHTPSSVSGNQVGMALGGALRKDRLFFYANAEGDFDSSTVTRTGQAPTTSLSSQDAMVQQILKLIPTSASGTYRGVQSNGSTSGLGMARLDYLATPRHVLAMTFVRSGGSHDDPADSSPFGSDPTTTLDSHSTFLSASWRWSPTARLTNELRAGVSNSALDFRNSLRAQFPFIATLNDPSVALSQPMQGRDPQGLGDRVRSYQDTAVWTKGKHTIQAGLWFQQYGLESYGFDNGLLDSLTVPRYVVSNIAQGAISQVDQRFNITSQTSGYSAESTARSSLAAHMLSPYLQETFRPFRSLIITLGMRYDFLSPAIEQTGTAILPVLTGLASVSVYDKQMSLRYASPTQPFYPRDIDNYSPHMGVAWKPSAKLPVVLRGSTSTVYLNDDLLPNMSLYALRNPFQSFDVSTNLSGSTVRLSKAPVTAVPSMPATLNLPSLLAFANSYGQQPGPLYGVDPNLRTPNVKYWHVGAEAEWKGTQVSVRYVGNRLEEGPRSVDRNQPMIKTNFLANFPVVQAALKSGAPTSGFPNMPGGGLCSNFNLQNCTPDLYARSLILTGQGGELARWYEGQGYNPDGNYNLLGNPLTPQGLYVLSHLGSSRYDALQWTVSRRMARGWNVTGSYVLSKMLSNLDDHQFGAVDPYLDVNNKSLEWATAPLNVRHAFKAAFNWDVPFAPVGAAARSLLGRVAGGWSVAGIMIAQSGAPFSFLSGGYVTEPDGSTAMVTGLGTFVSQADSGQNTVSTSFSTPQLQQYLGIHKNGDGSISYVNSPAGSFAEPAFDTLGNLQRRSLTGPAAFNVDLGLRKGVRLGERFSAEVRAETTNLFNNVNWLVGDQTYLGGSGFNNNVRQWNAPRTFQFQLRVGF